MTKGRRVVPVVIAAVGVVPAALVWSRLPEMVATHWDGDGTPNGHGSRRVGVGGPAVVAAVLAATLALELRRVPPRYVVAMLLGGFGAAAAAVSLSTALANADVAAWPDAHLPVLAVLGQGLAVVLGGGLTVLVLNDRWAAPRRQAPAPATPPTGPRAAWSGTARGGWALAFCVALAALYLVLLAVSGSYLVGIVLVVVGVAVYGTLCSVQVTVGAHGLTARSPIGWPAVTIPLADIVDVEATTIEPMSWGGWGYRGSLRVTGTAAWIVRQGEGIVLHLAEGHRFAVTVDDSAAAAETLSAYTQS